MYGSIGKLGLVTSRLTTNQAIAFAQPAPIDSKYLFWYLRKERGNLAALGKGGTQKNISQTVLKSYPFPLAPLREQGAIVDEIETQFSRLDAGLAALKRVQANLDRYRSSVLRAACEGRLVPTEAELAHTEGREYKSAEELLERILTERRRHWEEAQLEKMGAKGKEPQDDRWKKKYKEPEPPDTSELPELPEGWAWSTIDALTEVQGGLTKGKKRKPTDRIRNVPYLRVANVQRGYLDLDEVKEIQATKDEIDKLRLEPGDLLFNEGGDRDKLGRGWVWSGEIQDCIHQNHVFRARPVSDDLEPKFVSWFGNTLGRTYFMREGRQTTNLASINLTKLRQLPVPVPPRVEQQRIVDRVEEILSVVEVCREQVRLERQRAQLLRQSILKRAFEGKLVPQDPDDEPASVLLERIRSERKSESETRRSRRSKGAQAQ